MSVGMNLTCQDLNYRVNINLSLLHLFIIIISIVLDYKYFQKSLSLVIFLNPLKLVLIFLALLEFGNKAVIW